MKHLRHLALCLLLVLSMATSAFAAEVPDTFVTENLNPRSGYRPGDAERAVIRV